jgi:myo-inositol-1(or 4)-monophosphatase
MLQPTETIQQNSHAALSVPELDPTVKRNELVRNAIDAVSQYLTGLAPELRKEMFEVKRIEVKIDGSVVTETDKRIEGFLQGYLPTLIPGSIVLGEETAPKSLDEAKKLFENEYIWVVDPIDGTTNFSMGIPLFAVSIGLIAKDGDGHRPIGGALLYPGSNEMLTTAGSETVHTCLQRGSSSKLEKRRPLSDAIPLYITEYQGQAGDTRIPDIALRHNGATAVDIGFLCLGRAHGTICSSSIWDFAAAHAVAETQGISFRAKSTGEKKTTFTPDDFRFDVPERAWRLKERYLVSNDENYPQLKSIFAPEKQAGS